MVNNFLKKLEKAKKRRMMNFILNFVLIEIEISAYLKKHLYSQTILLPCKERTK